MATSVFSNFVSSFAEFSSLFSLTAILICATITFFFILRLIRQDLLEEGGGVTHLAQVPAPRMDMQRVPLPFHIALDPEEQSLEKLTLRLSSKPPWQVGVLRMRIYAGVSIPVFHHVLRSPWSWLLQAFEHGNPFGQDGCLGMSEPMEFELADDCDEKTVEIPVPCGEGPLDLGEIPRQKYPLVVCSMPKEFEARENVGRLGALFQVIHIKDEVCRFPTRILSSHLKLLDGNCISLGQIFVSNDDLDDDGEEEKGKPRCVVCQDHKVTRVIFPCRHACACSSCFPKLKNRCPMCRTFINSYFLLEEEPEVVDNDERDTELPKNWRQRIHDWNRSFALAMGLQEN